MAEPGKTADSKLKVFISYSRDDLDFADQLVAGLEVGGFEPTIDRHGISGGEDWKLRLGGLLRDADTIVFVLSPASARSEICAWEVEEAARLGKRILPVNCRPLEGATPPTRLQDLNYIFFYAEPKSPGSGFGAGLAQLVTALNTDFDWIREHTRLLQRATEWDRGKRLPIRLLSGDDIAAAKAWAARRPERAPEPTVLHLDFIKASEQEETARAGAERKRLDDMAAVQTERANALKAAEDALKREAQAQRRSTKLRNVGLFVLSLAAAVAGLLAYIANGQRTKAVANLRAGQTTESYFRAEQAMRALTAADATTGLLVALDGLPDAGSDDPLKRDRPYVPEAEHALRTALWAHRERAVLAGHAGPVRSTVFSTDGSRILTASDDKTARVWSADGKLLAVLGGPDGHQGPVQSATFSI
jgi:TIR domain/WD domain, G-beta repeat